MDSVSVLLVAHEELQGLLLLRFDVHTLRFVLVEIEWNKLDLHWCVSEGS